MKSRAGRRKDFDLLVVGILGSPRRGGNAELLLDRALEGARSAGAETEKLVVNEMDILPFQDCSGCDETGECIYEDDTERVYEAVRRADGVVIATPIFFGSLPAQLKGMIDRFQNWWVAKYVMKAPLVPDEERSRRLGLFICVGGMKRRDYFEAARKLIRIFFATTNITYAGDLFYEGIDAKGAIKLHETALNDAYEAGRKLAGQLATPETVGQPGTS